jgi:hypothetical protein
MFATSGRTGVRRSRRPRMPSCDCADRGGFAPLLARWLPPSPRARRSTSEGSAATPRCARRPTRSTRARRRGGRRRRRGPRRSVGTPRPRRPRARVQLPRSCSRHFHRTARGAAKRGWPANIIGTRPFGTGGATRWSVPGSGSPRHSACSASSCRSRRRPRSWNEAPKAAKSSGRVPTPAPSVTGPDSPMRAWRSASRGRQPGTPARQDVRE